MNVVSTGSVYQIYDEGMQTAKKLPPLTYDVCFSKMQGFFLTSRPSIKSEEEKIYGSYIQKVNKVISGYESVDRNFGIILSGPKGVGKTLFAKVLSASAQAKGYPILVVSDYIPGISHFLSSIDQDVIILFDEFEKVFCQKEDCSPQDEMLTLFDGLDGGHKLFVVICNSLDKLNSYILNRPGRFHYHFALDVPSVEEIREYLQDKLAPPYQNEIDRIINLANMGKITYDCLRAIVFELNQGYSLEETISDLNISRDRSITFDIEVEFMDGIIYKAYSESLNLISNKPFGRWFKPALSVGSDREAIWVEFVPSDAEPDPNRIGSMYIPVDKLIDVHFDGYEIDDEDKSPFAEAMRNRVKEKPKSVRLTRTLYDSYKYLV